MTHHLTSVFNIAQICAMHGITEAILSPGSRCAPLTISFARHPSINTKIIPDERAAAFVALGTSLQTQKTTVLICTSGSAAYNYAPAVAEAYYQKVPLLILTADRPPEWIDQLDGQTIRQQNIYGSHVKASFQTPVDTEHGDARWHINRIVNDALNIAKEYPAGPVHINVPLREPLYSEEEIIFDNNARVVTNLNSSVTLQNEQFQQLGLELNKFQKIMVVAGQGKFNLSLNKSLQKFIETSGAVLVSDIISNTSAIPNAVTFQDTILAANSNDVLKPDLIISFGNSVISKSLKLFLRRASLQHWHIQESGDVADTFQSLTKMIRCTPEILFSSIASYADKKNNIFHQQWKEKNHKASKFLEKYFSTIKTYHEFSAVQQILNTLPEDSLLHLANSMPVRYANYLSIAPQKNIEIFCNRGTSGIDGVISTALGTALHTKKIVTVITGDMAFLYDRNAWWHNEVPSNLRIVVLNNHGGGIFQLIDGPSKQPELKKYFVTEQKLNASLTAQEYQLEYFHSKTHKETDRILQNFFMASDRSKLLEIETSTDGNTEQFRNFKKQIVEYYAE